VNKALHTVPLRPDNTGEQIRRRREAANAPDVHRLACGRYDPLDPLPRPVEPSDFGLTIPELRAEIARCQRAGWQPWEIRARFKNPADLRRELDATYEADRIRHPHLENTYV
jgi:hypothetical protein